MRKIFARHFVYQWPESLFIHFLEYKQSQGCKDATLKIYWRNLKRFGAFLRQQEGITQTLLSLVDVRIFERSLIALHKNMVQNLPKSRWCESKYVSLLNQYISVWRNFSFWLSNTDWLSNTETIIGDLRRPVKSFKLPNLLPQVIDLRKFFQIDPYVINKSFLDWRNFCLIDLFAGAGLRVSEVIKLQIGNISKTGCKIILDSRFKNPRTVFLHPASYQYLCEYLRLLHEWLGMRRLNPKYPLFITRLGNVLSASVVTYSVKQWMHRHLLFYTNPLTLRRSYTYDLYFKTGDPLITKLVVGYRSFAAVFKYDRINFEVLHKEYQKHPRCHVKSSRPDNLPQRN